MDIILLKDIDNLGYQNDVVSVKPGYARNFLIPKGVAVIANKANKEKLDKILADIEAKESVKREEYKGLASQIQGKTLRIPVKAGTSGKIFGSVTNVQIAQALQEQLNIEVERKKIVMPEEVKELGTYSATIKFSKDVESQVEFELIQD